MSLKSIESLPLCLWFINGTSVHRDSFSTFLRVMKDRFRFSQLLKARIICTGGRGYMRSRDCASHPRQIRWRLDIGYLTLSLQHNSFSSATFSYQGVFIRSISVGLGRLRLGKKMWKGIDRD